MSIFYIFIQWDRSIEIVRANKAPSVKSWGKSWLTKLYSSHLDG